MPQGKNIKNSRNGRLLARDGAGNTVVLVDVDGEWTIGGLRPGLVETTEVRARGDIVGYVKGDKQTPTMDLTTWMRNFSGSIRDTSCGLVVANLYDVCHRVGACAGWVSTGDPCVVPADQFCFDLIWQIEGTDLGDPSDHEVVAKACYPTEVSAVSALGGNQWTASLQVRGGIEGDITLVM
jgi:hypothetical protein